MAAERRAVEVHADWRELGAATRMGTLFATPVRAKETFSFEFDEAWLDLGQARALDSALRLGPGPQYVAAGRDNFGLFLDSSPDRWGRVLMQRREAQLARELGRKERRLTELDYLLGVYDGHRLGGLRFSVGDGPYLDDDAELASPPWTSLRELEQACLRLEDDDSDSAESGKWLRMLVAPGRSLGGARPKVSVVDEQGQLWIAKFPSSRDSNDIGAWESVVATLASRAGINVADNVRRRFGSRHHTFLAKRFDRGAGQQRIHFCSAMTLLERTDGEAGASYLDLADVLVRHGAEPARDLEQLWRRIAFYACVSNVDDHLRNHGFLLSSDGWVLAPAYDVNPVSDASGLTLNITETDNAQDLSLVRDVARAFRVGARKADEILAEVASAVRDWRAVAEQAQLSRAEQARMAPAFRLVEST
jgi:serine/threonine-protein kinase HipA